IAGECADAIVVFDDQNTPRLLAAGRGDLVALAVLCCHVFTHAWQVDLHGRAVTGSAVHLHVATRLLDEAKDLAQSESSALTQRLGGEEWLERAGQDLLRHANPGVAEA